MEAIHFQTEVGSDNTIRVPDGVILPAGPLNVTISPCLPPPRDEDIPKTWEWLLAMAKESERLNPDLPSDLAANHDYYAHGKPRE